MRESGAQTNQKSRLIVFGANQTNGEMTSSRNEQQKTTMAESAQSFLQERIK
jgi:hypothetical protein